MEAFECDHGIISNQPARNKNTLRFGYNFVEERAKPVDKALGDDFVYHVAQTRWSKVLQSFKVVSFRD